MRRTIPNYTTPDTAFDQGGRAFAGLMKRGGIQDECFTVFRAETNGGRTPSGMSLVGMATFQDVDAAMEFGRTHMGDPRTAPSYLLGYEVRSTETGEIVDSFEAV